MATAPIPIDYTTYNKILDLAEARKSLRPGLTVEAALQGLAQEQPGRPEYAQAYQRYTRRPLTRPAVTKAAPAPPVRKAAAAVTTQTALPQPSFEALVRNNLSLGMNPDQAWALAERQSPAAHEAFRNPGGTPAPVQKEAPPSPPPSATDTLIQTIATRQAAEPGLSFVAALDAVHKEAPALYDAYQAERRYPHPHQSLTKQADPAPTYEAIVAMADARVAKTAGLSRRDALSALVQEHPGEQAYYETYRKYHLSDGLAEHHAARRAQGRVD